MLRGQLVRAHVKSFPRTVISLSEAREANASPPCKKQKNVTIALVRRENESHKYLRFEGVVLEALHLVLASLDLE
eukprot:1221529-Rhodomonas_salina.2